jgi:hypothetical protein
MKRLMNVAHPMPQEFKSLELCLVVRTARRQDRCVPSNSYQDAFLSAGASVGGKPARIPRKILGSGLERVSVGGQAMCRRPRRNQIQCQPSSTDVSQLACSARPTAWQFRKQSYGLRHPKPTRRCQPEKETPIQIGPIECYFSASISEQCYHMKDPDGRPAK